MKVDTDIDRELLTVTGDEGHGRSRHRPRLVKPKVRVVKPCNIFLLLFRSKSVKIEPLLLIYMFSRFFYIPLFQQYYFARFASDLLQNTSFSFPNGSFCLNSSVIDKYAGKDTYKVVETYSNNLVLYTQLAVRIPGMITILILGPLSDRFGRKPVLLLSLLGTFMQGIVAVVIVGFRLSPYLFILAGFLTGFCGDFTGLLAGAFSYIADVSTPKWRTFRIGMIEGMLAIGGAIGQFSSGYLLNQLHCYFLPLVSFGAACALVAMLWVIFLVPESLTPEERLERVAGKPGGAKVALQGLKMFLGRMPQYSAWKLWVAVVMLNLPLFNTQGNLLINVFFLKAPPFDANAAIIGGFQALSSIARAVSVTLVLFSFSVALRMSDGASALVGISFQLIANVLMGFAKTEIQVYFIAIVQGVEAISWAAGRSLMSKLVEKEDQGALFSVVASIQSLVSLLSSVFWPLVYPLTLDNKNLPTGFIYIVMAMVDLLAYPLLISLIISEVVQRRSREQTSVDEETDKLLDKEEPSMANYSTVGTANHSTINADDRSSLVYSITGGSTSIN